MAEKVESENGTGRTSVDGGDGLGAAIDPDELAIAFVCLLLDPDRIGFAVSTGAGEITGPVDDPDQIGLAAVLEPDLSHAEGGGADEVGPPPVVLFIFITQILPLAQGGTSTEDYVFPDGRGEAGEGEKDRQEDQESHGLRMRQAGPGGKEGVEAVL